MEAQPNNYGSELTNELNELLKVVVQKPEINNEQCIYKVPQKIRQVNPQAYTPQVISIGPLHNPRVSISDNNNLHEMEELKLKYFKGFLDRTHLCVNHLVCYVQEWENKIRNCYVGPISIDSKDFLKIIIVDACFIIELFVRCWGYREGMENVFSPSDWSDDPILSKHGLYIDIYGDLILLENQLPFFVLEEIYKLARLDINFDPFLYITMWYFERFSRQSVTSNTLHPKHFTDFLRTCWLSTFHLELEQDRYDFTQPQHVYSTSQLLEVGLKFELRHYNDIEFHKGVLKMPQLIVQDLTERCMRNIIAFEECHIPHLKSYIVQYLSILNFLINTEKDVSILIDKNIIDNQMGHANEVATMINNLCTNVTMPTLNSEYASLCNKLNDFYNNPRNRYKAIFVREYLSTPWKIASTITAVLLVLFTFIQTVCSIWSLVK